MLSTMLLKVIGNHHHHLTTCLHFQVSFLLQPSEIVEMHDIWPASNTSDYSSTTSFPSHEEKRATMFALPESSSSQELYDTYYDDGAIVDLNTVFGENCRKRIRRRSRRRRSGRSLCNPADMMANEFGEKNNEDYASDEFADHEELSSSQSTNSSNAPGPEHMLANPSLPSLNSIDNIDNIYGQPTAYQLSLMNSNNNNNKLKPIIVDGTNVALCHGNNDCYSYQGIQTCLEWFKKRGHADIKVVLPSWHVDANSSLLYSYRGKEILMRSEVSKHLLYTNSSPSDRHYICSYIINLAIKTTAIIVSNDRYGDVTKSDSEMKKMVYERLLSFVFNDDDTFTPPDTPLGRYGPTIDVFLQHSNRSQFAQICPYKSRCTYGNKCRYYHPENGSTPYFVGSHTGGSGHTFNSLPIFNRRSSSKDYLPSGNGAWSNTIGGRMDTSSLNRANAHKPGLLNLEAAQAYGSNTSLPYTPTYSSALSFDFDANEASAAQDKFETDTGSSDLASGSSRSSPSDLAVDCVENLWKNDSVGCNLMSTLSSGMDKEKTRYLLFCRLCSFYPYKLVKQAMDELPLETEMHVLDSRVKALLNESK